MIVTLKQETTNIVKAVPLGFSWNILFLGPLVPLFRGDFKWFFLGGLIVMCTAGLGLFAFPFIYNKVYVNDLMNKGYVPTDEGSINLLKLKGISYREKSDVE